MTRPSPLLAAAVGLVVWTAACGSNSEKHVPERMPVVTPSLDEKPGDRLVVAEVNGVPIYSDCVETQAEQKGITVSDALDECIGFELLAREAEKRGLLRDGDVLEARKTEAVRAFIEKDFAESFASPEDIPERELREFYDTRRRIYVQEEYRVANYVRVLWKPRRGKKGRTVSAVPEEGSLDDLRAKMMCQELHALLGPRRNLTDRQALQLSRDVYGDRVMPFPQEPGDEEVKAVDFLNQEPKEFDFPLRGRVVDAFADAAWSIDEPGRVSECTRTQWGWDLVLLIRIIPARNYSYEDAIPNIRERIFTMSRRRGFFEWTKKTIGRPAVDVDNGWLERLAEADMAEERLFDPEFGKNRGAPRP